MYLGFNLSLNDEKAQYIQEGKKIVSEQLTTIHAKLEQYTSKNGGLNGNRIQQDWFPLILCDVFISHSHADEDKAHGLAGWLSSEFGIKAFVDSTVWGYADTLLKEIDNRYCRTEDKLHYDYNLRNGSTSHVHLMLSMALAKMIERTECLFFLNPSSITTEESINRTRSPWIYYEIGISALLRQKEPRLVRNNEIIKAFSYIRENLEIEYELDAQHLREIDNMTLIRWLQKYRNSHLRNGIHPLDFLYQTLNDDLIQG